MSINQNTSSKPSVFSDASFWTLLVSNLVAIFLAYLSNWDLFYILRVYWVQSVIIGVVNFIRIWQLQNFTTEGLTSNGSPVPATKAGKRSTALFFLAHYGLFHIVYFVFVFIAPATGPAAVAISQTQLLYLALGGALFLFHHLSSYFYNKSRDTKVINLGTVLFYPYARVVPMHLVILFGYMFGSQAIYYFLALKTLADLLMHSVEHSWFREK